MKKLILCLLFIFVLITTVGCTKKQDELKYGQSDLQYLVLEKSNEKQDYISGDLYNNFISSISEFSTDLSEKLFIKYHNKYDQMAVSPISLYMALAMATSIASSDAQEELSLLLGIPYDEMIEYTKYLYSQLNKERYDDNDKAYYMMKLNNSIWVDDNLLYKQEGLKQLSDSFYTDSYKVPFKNDNNKANKAIQDFVCRNTKGLINNKYNFDIYTLFLLINTLYLKDTWNTFGDELETTNEYYNFKNQNLTLKQLKLLKGNYVAGNVQEGDGFEYFYTKTSNLKLYFIKPTTKTLDEIYNSTALNTVLNDNDYNIYNHELKEIYNTRCLFPEFNASFNEDIVDILKQEYGITKIFRENTTNFDKLTDKECLTTSIIHQTKLIVDRKGIEGAAVTILANGDSSVGGVEYQNIYRDFIIDESFGFLITSGDVVLFSGVINNL